MSKLNFYITQEMVNTYYLYLKTPYAKKQNLFRLWSKEVGFELDGTQRQWVEDCIKGKRSMNIYSRHGRNFITQEQVMKPDKQNSKGLASTLDEMSEKDEKAITKSLKARRFWK